MIKGPHSPAHFSVSKSGEIAEKPDNHMSVVVKDGNGNASGVLMKWDKEEWMYAKVDSFVDIN